MADFKLTNRTPRINRRNLQHDKATDQGHLSAATPAIPSDIVALAENAITGQESADELIRLGLRHYLNAHSANLHPISVTSDQKKLMDRNRFLKGPTI